MEKCLTAFYSEYECINNSSVMKSQQQSQQNFETLKPSETCSSLETIPQMSTHRKPLMEAEDDLTHQIINLGQDETGDADMSL